MYEELLRRIDDSKKEVNGMVDDNDSDFERGRCRGYLRCVRMVKEQIEELIREEVDKIPKYKGIRIEDNIPRVKKKKKKN